MHDKKIKLAIVVSAALLVVMLLGWYISRIGLLNRFSLNKTQENTGVFGKVFEDAVEPRLIASAVVRINDKTTRTDENGIYRIDDLPIGQVKIETEAGTRHEKYKKVVELKAGENKANIALSLTPDETMRQWLKAQSEGRFDKAYQYLHPQVRKLYSKKQYIQFNTNFRRQWAMKEFKAAKAVILKTWIHKPTRRAYKNVAEVGISITFQAKVAGLPSEKTDSTKAHLVKVGRQWKTFWSLR